MRKLVHLALVLLAISTAAFAFSTILNEFSGAENLSGFGRNSGTSQAVGHSKPVLQRSRLSAFVQLRNGRNRQSVVVQGPRLWLETEVLENAHPIPRKSADQRVLRGNGAGGTACVSQVSSLVDASALAPLSLLVEGVYLSRGHHRLEPAPEYEAGSLAHFFQKASAQSPEVA
jgi:hypothetical protein